MISLIIFGHFSSWLFLLCFAWLLLNCVVDMMSSPIFQDLKYSIRIYDEDIFIDFPDNRPPILLPKQTKEFILSVMDNYSAVNHVSLSC